MLVCSIGARFSDDPKVFNTEDSVQTPGWKWFEQVVGIQKLQLSPPSLYNVQSYAVNILPDFFITASWFVDVPLKLMAQYLGVASSGNACWTLVGIGLRLSQDVGAHRRSPRNRLPAEDELWKRAFWYGCPCSTGTLLTIFLGCY
jgi:hypothetical protein